MPADSVPHGTSAESGDPLYRAPTGDEITSIRETTGLFRSNLFRMQVSNLCVLRNVYYNRIFPPER